MRTVPAGILAAKESHSSRLCKLWRIERIDGAVVRYTDHDQDITIDGEVFVATAFFDPSAIKTGLDMSVSDLEVLGALDVGSADDLLAGKWNGASFLIGECLWDDPTAGVVIDKFGWIGNIKEVGNRFVAELLGPERILQRDIIRSYTPGCNALLGDDRCGVDLAPTTQTGTVASVTNNRFWSATGLVIPSGDPGDYFQFGTTTFISGDNAGLSMETRSCDGTWVQMMLPLPFDVAVGDQFTITPGCNKSLGACRFKFDNVLNFRGFPHVPQSDDVVKGIARTEVENVDGGMIWPTPDDGAGSP
jgi:uncharacterized phage protein (TIGR02218 family)